MTQQVERNEIVDMLRREASAFGLTLERFYDLGQSGDLDEPRLRDLWLIWGNLLVEADLGRAVPA